MARQQVGVLNTTWMLMNHVHDAPKAPRDGLGRAEASASVQSLFIRCINRRTVLEVCHAVIGYCLWAGPD